MGKEDRMEDDLVKLNEDATDEVAGGQRNKKKGEQ